MHCAVYTWATEVAALEALVAQVPQLQACDQQHAALELGFVLGLARARGQRRHVEVRGQDVVGEVDVGLWREAFETPQSR